MISFRNLVARHLKNSFGWSTDKKIILFSVDDYGAIRMESREARDKLIKRGLKVESKFDMYDALEDKDDLSMLFETLKTFKDINGKHPVFTAFAIPANPDFDMIIANGYNSYHYETLKDTWSRLHEYEGVDKLWQYGINNRLIFPEFHGREHLNLKFLMEGFKQKDPEIINCFENRSYGAISSIYYNTISYVAAFDFDEFSEYKLHESIIDDGLNCFEEVFGFRAMHFAAPGAREHSVLDSALAKGGIHFIDSDFIKIEHQGKGSYKRSIQYTGQRNSNNQFYIVRNCVFEPSPNDSIDWVSYCMKQIEIAFLWNKPANISTHRVNFAGHIDEKNRKSGLLLLRKLLSKILQRWPDVEFYTTRELGNLISTHKQK